MAINVKYPRLNIDVFPEEHRRIKTYAAFHDKTIREYVLGILRERLRVEEEKNQLSAMTIHLDQDTILKELWDNEKDAAYDKISTGINRILKKQ